MERLHSSLRTPGAFSLIILLQAHLAASHPFPAPEASPENNSTREGGRQSQYFAPKNVVPPYPVEDQASSCSSDTAWPTTYTISEIADGQIQAPYHRKYTDHPSRSDWTWSSNIAKQWPTPAVTTSESQTVMSSQSSAESSIISPIVFGSITLTWSTSYDTTSGTPALAASFPPTTATQTQTQTEATPSSTQQASSNQQTSAQQTSNADTFTTSSSVVQPSSDEQTSVEQTSSNEPSSAVPYSSSSDSSATNTASTLSDQTSLQQSSTEASLTSSSSTATAGSSMASTTDIPVSPASSETSSAEQPSSEASSDAPASSAAPASSSASAETSVASSVQQASAETSSAAPASSPVIPTSAPSSPPITPTQESTAQSLATIVVSTSVPDISLTSLTTSEVQSATAPVLTNTTGVIQTSLQTLGNPSAAPFPTSVVSGTSTISLVDTSTLSNVQPTNTANVTSIGVGNIFQPMASNAPPAQISSRSDHPVRQLGIQPQSGRVETNKFYANLFLGDQDQPTYTFPYSVTWSRGAGQTKSWGMAVSHTERNQLGTGSSSSTTAAWSFYANPIGIQSLVLSAAQLTEGTRLTTDSLTGFSLNVNLIPQGASQPAITFPLVQGMAFVTGSYRASTPVISSGVGINNITYVGTLMQGSVYKYRLELANGFTWLAYVTPSDSDYNANSFTLLSPNTVQGPSNFGGYIQVSKIPASTPNAESVYDSAAGAYPTAGSISGSVDGTSGSYTLSWTKAGVQSQSLLMFALPHHVQSFTGSTSNGRTDVQLVTPTKGFGTAIRADSWTLVENDLPVDMDFAPWRPGQGSIKAVSAAATALINQAGTSELAQDPNIFGQTNTDSMYYSGKAFAKFAAIVYTLHDIGGNVTLALTGLEELEDALNRFVSNNQTYPLVYDEVWGGVVSSGTYITGNSGVDFGNTYYNDHHFHYGYFVYAAAVIAYLDPTWLTKGTNKAWIDTLVRDYANPIENDPYYPFSRNFDWFHGHSWAGGLFATADGKNQESSSEDTMASYAMKMWGQISGDAAMEARGNLMLSIQARSFENYYLYTSENTVEPADFIGNKAAGILFENKIDHTTYFGNNIEYIEGIHMIPLMPFSTLTRRQQFVQEEWDTYFANSITAIQGGWRGILEANHAIIDAQASYAFFSNSTGQLQQSYLDGGASLTWYLAYSAALGGAPASAEVKPRWDMKGQKWAGRLKRARVAQ